VVRCRPRYVQGCRGTETCFCRRMRVRSREPKDAAACLEFLLDLLYMNWIYQIFESSAPAIATQQQKFADCSRGAPAGCRRRWPTRSTRSWAMVSAFLLETKIFFGLASWSHEFSKNSSWHSCHPPRAGNHGEFYGFAPTAQILLVEEQIGCWSRIVPIDVGIFLVAGWSLFGGAQRSHFLTPNRPPSLSLLPPHQPNASSLRTRWTWGWS
jgi:hypothetical protein